MDALLQMFRQLCQVAEKNLWLELSRNLENKGKGVKWVKFSNGLWRESGESYQMD